MKLDIIDGKEFYIDDCRFVIDMSLPADRKKSDENSFTIVKQQVYFNFYEQIYDTNPKSIFEVGFFEGGSSVFFDTYFKPDQLTCVDIRKHRIAAVDAYAERKGRTGNFRMQYGFDQSDAAGLTKLVNEHHGGSLDLVIDDASHDYHLSKATFETLFPMVKPNGLYILEDYGWAHAPNFQGEDHPWRDRDSLANLVFEFVMMMSSSAGLIKNVEINRGLCAITRGPQPNTGPIKVADEYLNRGKTLTLI